MATRRQGLGLFTAIALLVGTLVIIQLWLVSASVDAWLSAELEVLLPAAGASLVLFAANAALLFYVIGFDRRVRRGSRG